MDASGSARQRASAIIKNHEFLARYHVNNRELYSAFLFVILSSAKDQCETNSWLS
jgi:hypothetical protein